VKPSGGMCRRREAAAFAKRTMPVASVAITPSDRAASASSKSARDRASSGAVPARGPAGSAAVGSGSGKAKPTTRSSARLRFRVRLKPTTAGTVRPSPVRSRRIREKEAWPGAWPSSQVSRPPGHSPRGRASASAAGPLDGVPTPPNSRSHASENQERSSAKSISKAASEPSSAKARSRVSLATTTSSSSLRSVASMWMPTTRSRTPAGLTIWSPTHWIQAQCPFLCRIRKSTLKGRAPTLNLRPALSGAAAESSG